MTLKEKAISKRALIDAAGKIADDIELRMDAVRENITAYEGYLEEAIEEARSEYDPETNGDDVDAYINGRWRVNDRRDTLARSRAELEAYEAISSAIAKML